MTVVLCAWCGHPLASHSPGGCGVGVSGRGDGRACRCDVGRQVKEIDLTSWPPVAERRRKGRRR